MRNAHCRTWIMAKKLKIMENEKHPLDDLKNDEITKKREKLNLRFPFQYKNYTHASDE